MKIPKKPKFNKPMSDEQYTRTFAMMIRCFKDLRENMRRDGIDTGMIPYRVHDPDYTQAFGMLFQLEILGYGHLGANNVENDREGSCNLRYWFDKMLTDYIREDGYHSAFRAMQKVNSDIMEGGRNVI